MKRKVGELYNVPIVEGDPNLLKSNEILHKGGGQLSKRNNTGKIEDLGNSDSGEGGSGDCDLKMTYVADPDNQLPGLITFNAALVKAVFDDGAITNIVPYGYGVFYQSRISKILAYAIPFGLKIRADGTTIQEANTLSDDDIANLPQITEEEFYNLNTDNGGGE